MKLREHGGDIAEAARDLGIPAQEILDFSSNINPRGLPPRAAERLARESRDAALLARYPDAQCGELRAVLSRKLDVPPESLVFGSGGAAVILAAVLALRPRTCLLPVPGFAEYARACRAAQCSMEAWNAPAPLPAGYDLAIVNNPHNPTGAALSLSTMRIVLDAAQSAGTFLFADEAFIDFLPEESITHDAAERRGVVAIRSLTKFYGSPALRAGYAVAHPETAAQIAALLPAWPIGTLAMNAFAEAVTDAAYERATIAACYKEREALTAALCHAGFSVAPAAANFLLVRLPEGGPTSGAVRERMLREHRILVRDCDSFEGLERGRYVRLAVRTEEENRRVVQALAAVWRSQ